MQGICNHFFFLLLSDMLRPKKMKKHDRLFKILFFGTITVNFQAYGRAQNGFLNS